MLIVTLTSNVSSLRRRSFANKAILRHYPLANQRFLRSDRKVGTGGSGEERCRMCTCGKATESVPHILAGCGALAQTLYLARHNNALKILFFQVIRALDLQ